VADTFLTTPRAVLIAGALIGLGLFFGMRDRRPEPAAGSSTSIPAAPITPVGPGAAAPGVADPSRPGEPAGVVPPPATTPAPGAGNSPMLGAAAAKQVSAAIEQHRKTLLKECWEPSVKKSPKPEAVKLVFNFTFDEQGKQIIRGIHETRDANRPDVTSCVTDKLPPLQIAPPGKNTYIEVPFTLP
jgi:hypothetical protein